MLRRCRCLAGTGVGTFLRGYCTVSHLQVQHQKTCRQQQMHAALHHTVASEDFSPLPFSVRRRAAAPHPRIIFIDLHQASTTQKSEIMSTGTNTVTQAQNGVKTISLAEIAKHDNDKDCFLAIHGQVYDITKFLDEVSIRSNSWVGLQQWGRPGKIAVAPQLTHVLLLALACVASWWRRDRAGSCR